MTYQQTIEKLPYRSCVGIVLYNSEGNVFVGERLDNPGAWQMPQGGIDKGETIEEAFFRELQEEAGTDKAKIIKVYEKPLRYDLPPHLLHRLWNGKYRGQEQHWVAAIYEGEDYEIDIECHTFPEFRRWKWASPLEILDMIVPFKRNTYEEVLTAFKGLV